LPLDSKNNFQFLLPFFPGSGPKVLVGFARAVGDAALVATVHDIAVLPEMRGKGLGKILVEKLTDQVRLFLSNFGLFNVCFSLILWF
jgi:GNAT superfamily N-acetyltransferase